MFRSIFLPTLVACAIAFPILYQKSTSVSLDPQFQNANRDADYYVANTSQPYQTQSFGQPSAAAAPVLTTAFPASTIQSDLSNRNVPTTSTMPTITPASSSLNAPIQFNGGVQMMPASHLNVGTSSAVDFSQMTPDYGAAETYTFRGNANGPDLTSAPLQFVPISNFQEVFRFDVSPAWVKQRWDRLTMIPAEGGLHGLRTALVTGTNTWDLNGSLTYFFDQNHRPQRISFRGWVGDPTRLVSLATGHFGLKPRPTHWTGLYVANFGGSPTAALLLKDPNTIDRRNQVQRTAIIMEINQPAGEFKLSNEVAGFVQAATPVN